MPELPCYTTIEQFQSFTRNEPGWSLILLTSKVVYVEAKICKCVVQVYIHVVTFKVWCQKMMLWIQTLNIDVSFRFTHKLFKYSLRLLPYNYIYIQIKLLLCRLFKYNYSNVLVVLVVNILTYNSPLPCKKKQKTKYYSERYSLST